MQRNVHIDHQTRNTSSQLVQELFSNSSKQKQMLLQSQPLRASMCSARCLPRCRELVLVAAPAPVLQSNSFFFFEVQFLFLWACSRLGLRLYIQVMTSYYANFIFLSFCTNSDVDSPRPLRSYYDLLRSMRERDSEKLQRKADQWQANNRGITVVPLPHQSTAAINSPLQNLYILITPKRKARDVVQYCNYPIIPMSAFCVILSW